MINKERLKHDIIFRGISLSTKEHVVSFAIGAVTGAFAGAAMATGDIIGEVGGIAIATVVGVGVGGTWEENNDLKPRSFLAGVLVSAAAASFGVHFLVTDAAPKTENTAAQATSSEASALVDRAASYGRPAYFFDDPRDLFIQQTLIYVPDTKPALTPP